MKIVWKLCKIKRLSTILIKLTNLQKMFTNLQKKQKILKHAGNWLDILTRWSILTSSRLEAPTRWQEMCGEETLLKRNLCCQQGHKHYEFIKFVVV